MHYKNNPKAGDPLRSFLTRACLLAALPYLAFAILLVIAISIMGRELEHHINAIESWIAQLGPRTPMPEAYRMSLHHDSTFITLSNGHLNCAFNPFRPDR